jgi:hypothetical protein
MQIAIVGHGRAGKDTASQWLGEHTTLRYQESTSEAAAKLCYQHLHEKYSYSSVQEAFADRHNHREEWAKIIWDYNQPDGLTLYRGMLEAGDILNGIRREGELDALREHLMLDLVIWVERDVPKDPSQEMTSAVADIIIDNNGTLAQLYAKLARLSRVLKILR